LFTGEYVRAHSAKVKDMDNQTYYHFVDRSRRNRGECFKHLGTFSGLLFPNNILIWETLAGFISQKSKRAPIVRPVDLIGCMRRALIISMPIEKLYLYDFVYEKIFCIRVHTSKKNVCYKNKRADDVVRCKRLAIFDIGVFVKIVCG
jgi:hypothetical protein